MKPVLHRVRLVTPSRTDPHEPHEWPDWLVGVVLIVLLAVSAGTMAIILAVTWRALGRLLHVG